MAIILPLLVLLLVMAIDAGRLYFGSVALQNAGRIGADYAANNANAWEGTPDPTGFQGKRDRYELLVTEDLQALGCQAGFVVPPPNFDPDGDGTEDFADGALARVDLDCVFDLLTPLAESFLGNPFTLHSRSDFAVNQTLFGGVPPPGNPPPSPAQCVAPELIGLRMSGPNNAQQAWAVAGFIEALQPTQPGNFTIGASPPPTPLLFGDQGSCATIEMVSP
jgi:hypothetical protein